MKALRARYPDEKNYVVAHDIDQPFTRELGGITLSFVSIKNLISKPLEEAQYNT